MISRKTKALAAASAALVVSGALSGAALVSAATTTYTRADAQAAADVINAYLAQPEPTVTVTESVPVPGPTVTVTATPTPTPTPTPTATVPASALPYAPPQGYLTYTKVSVPAGGGTLTLSNSTNYLIQCPSVVTGPVTVTGGNNRVWIGCVFGGRTTVPTGSYDSTNRGIRLSDGSDAGVDYLQGFWFKPGTYLSDAIQVAYRSNSNRDTYIQDVRVDATTIGSKAGVHADNLQLWGGSRSLRVYNWTGLSNTYQGFFINNSDGRTVPAKGAFSFDNVNLVGLSSPSYCFTDINPQNHTSLTASQFYCSGFARVGTNDSYSNAPAGVVSGTHPDFVPASKWSGATYLG